MAGNYPNTFYGVAAKALIKNDEGKILLVKEKSDKWDLPGGGLDHGEEPEAGLRRELQEEIGVSSGTTIGKIVKQKSFWLRDKQVWLMWTVYEVTLSEQVQLNYGEGVTDIELINPQSFQASEDERERFLAVFA